jgi:hypothetical protein
MPAARIFFQLTADFVVYLDLLIRPRKAIAAENLFLRRQLALYQERKVGPRRIDPATRITLAVLSRLLNWRDALIVVQPKTLDSLASSRVSTSLALEIKTGTPSDSC